MASKGDVVAVLVRCVAAAIVRPGGGRCATGGAALLFRIDLDGEVFFAFHLATGLALVDPARQPVIHAVHVDGAREFGVTIALAILVPVHDTRIRVVVCHLSAVLYWLMKSLL